MRNPLFTFLLLLSLSVNAAAGAKTIRAELFDPGFLEGDCNYHSITPASDGYIYFTIGTHHTAYSARLYKFDPKTGELNEVARMNAALGEDAGKIVPHGKIHTPLIENAGYLYFTTHTSTYEGNLPDLVPADGRAPYPGGHFVRYGLATGEIESLARIPMESEGLITLGMDRTGNRLVALTWPSGIVYRYDLASGQLLQFGAAQGRGEWGQLGHDWDFICRRLGAHPDGRFYGSTNEGVIWELDFEKQRPLRIVEGLSLDTVPPVAEANFTITDEPHYFWRNWRTILWNPETRSFWGLHGGSTQLFEFRPEAGMLRSVRNLRVPGMPGGIRNPLRTQLGFMLGPENTLFYLAHGPALEKPGRRDTKANVYLLTYAIDTDTLTNHGPVIGPDDRRVFFTESIALGPDGHLYSVAWVETLDPERMHAIQTSRGDALPAETRDVIYEIQLIRLPEAARFLDPW